MLIRLHEIRGRRLSARDGTIGKVDDFYFDDEWWGVRYLVADTGGWLTGKKVLISPAAALQPDWNSNELGVALTREQIEKSPDIAADQPVSRKHEAELAQYYGWPMYWGSTYLGGAYPGLNPAALAAQQHAQSQKDKGVTHLRSMREVRKYAVSARDGHAGHIDDFLAEDNDWRIRYLVVDTRDWLPGKKTLLPPLWAEEIRWDDAAVRVAVSVEEIKNSPPYDSSSTLDRAYEKRLYDYYGKKGYWEE